MQLRVEALAGHLERRLERLYCMSGDEPLLIEEALDALRTTARAAQLEAARGEPDGEQDCGNQRTTHRS